MTTDADLDEPVSRETVLVLRQALEEANQELAAAEQRIKAEAAVEITQLQQTIVALRSELSLQHDGFEAQLDAERRACHGEADQLRESIRAGREYADSLQREHASALSDLRTHFEREHAELRETITALRQQLGATGSGDPT